MASSVELYREAENRLWEATLQAQPTERMVALPETGLRVRVMEVGEGTPLLFVHGGPNAASTWAPLVRHLPDYRCILVDRPGCGLSDAPTRSIRPVRTFMATFLEETLRSLEAPARGIVASSFGSYTTLVHQAAWPDSALPTVHFGCPALVPGSKLPLRFFLQSLPGIRSLLHLIEPATLANSWEAFRRIGHQAAIDEGVVPEILMEWYTALIAHTDTRRNDMTGFSQVRPGTDKITPEDLARATAPQGYYWGTDDPFGGADVAEALVAMIPDAELRLVEESGHLPWLDAPEASGAYVRAFLTEQGP